MIFGLLNFPSWTAQTVSWTVQNWLYCTLSSSWPNRSRLRHPHLSQAAVASSLSGRSDVAAAAAAVDAGVFSRTPVCGSRAPLDVAHMCRSAAADCADVTAKLHTFGLYTILLPISGREKKTKHEIKQTIKVVTKKSA